MDAPPLTGGKRFVVGLCGEGCSLVGNRECLLNGLRVVLYGLPGAGLPAECPGLLELSEGVLSGKGLPGNITDEAGAGLLGRKVGLLFGENGHLGWDEVMPGS